MTDQGFSEFGCMDQYYLKKKKKKGPKINYQMFTLPNQNVHINNTTSSLKKRHVNIKNTAIVIIIIIIINEVNIY